MKHSLYSQELLKSLDDFVREMHGLDLADNPQLVSQLAIKWTRGQPLLTKKLLQYILESDSKISRGREAVRVEKTIRQRLLKEFKHDELTLPIRKILYVKDLARLLTKSQGMIGDREQIYLTRIRQELGLSSQQGENIQGQYSKSKLTADNKNNKQQSVLKGIRSESHKIDNAAFQDLVNLLERSPIYEELLATNNIDNRPQKISSSAGFLPDKSFWFCLAVPFLLLIIKAVSIRQNSEAVTSAIDVKTNSHCSNKIDSAQMSLGEKLLTQDRQLQSAAKVAFYEASTALSKCQYTTAQTKFRQTLQLERNNPEALIYLNNTKAIAKTNPSDNLKIAVSVPFEDRSDIAEEILKGVAQAQLEINQEGGINSKLLLVEIVNNYHNSEVVEKIAQKLAADKTVLAGIEYSKLERSAIAAKIYQQQDLVMVSASHSHSPKIDDPIISVAPNISNLVGTLYNYAAVSSFKKIAICADSNNMVSSLFAQEFINTVAQNGGEITTVPCDFAQENFNPVTVIDRALAQNADAVLLSASDDSIEQAISIAQINRGRLALLGNHLLHTDLTIEVGKETIFPLVLATPWLADTVTDRKLADDARNLWDTEINWRSAISYDATRAIAKALKQTQNRRQLTSAFGDRDFVSGTKIEPARLAYIGKPTSDSEGYQFLPLDTK